MCCAVLFICVGILKSGGKVMRSVQEWHTIGTRAAGNSWKRGVYIHRNRGVGVASILLLLLRYSTLRQPWALRPSRCRDWLVGCAWYGRVSHRSDCVRRLARRGSIRRCSPRRGLGGGGLVENIVLVVLLVVAVAVVVVVVDVIVVVVVVVIVIVVAIFIESSIVHQARDTLLESVHFCINLFHSIHDGISRLLKVGFHL
mmetsp:Transcript_16356/g.35563  ORF Transcript_16356/g.35563 Transcript_16356/m.35563 type:complete len:200 (+) Transcript_16356:127-726(+)